jgi:membrane-associated protease RseP (regulator of RpoE activity)
MKKSPFINIILFLLTFCSTLVVGAFHAGADILKDPMQVFQGLPFSVTLLGILLVHEFGHYLMSRRHGVAASLPYFIPFPSLFGTLGAVIKMKSPITTKNALVDIGASGPIAGFVVSVVAVVIGLGFSEVRDVTRAGEMIVLGDSLLFQILGWLVIGPIPSAYDLLLHPMAFAGWIGLFVTFINLFPVGQLDGGHIAYALLGKWHRWLSLALIGAFLTGGIVPSIISGHIEFNNWLVWGILLLILGPKHPPILFPDVPLDRTRKAVGMLALIIFILTFIPVPVSVR